MAKIAAASEAPVRPHSLTLNDRKTLTMSGVNEVSSFDEKQLVLRTEDGQMTVQGSGLHVTALLLEEGRVSVEGKIDAIAYTGRAAGGKGLMGLFR